MKFFDNLGKKVTAFAGRARLGLSKKSPEILLVGGIVAIVGGTVYAIASGDRAHQAMDQFNERMIQIKDNSFIADQSENPEVVYPVAQRQQDKRVIYGHMIMSMAKIYIPVVALETMGILMICKSHKIMSERYAGAMAYAAAQAKALNDYRKRVADVYGAEAEEKIWYGIEDRVVKELKTNEEGITTEVESKTQTIDPLDPYSRFIDETCWGVWEKQPQYTRSNLLVKQREANHVLNRDGFLTLNQVYSMLGLKQIPEGMILGWVADPNCEQKIDFGLDNGKSEAVRRFVNGYEDVVLVTFNMDGNIYDILKEKRQNEKLQLVQC